VEHGICPIAEFTSPWLLVQNLTSPLCSPTPISYNTREFWRFGHKWGPNCIFFIAHEQNGHISTSGQKSDVAIVFPDPDFLQDAGISVIRECLRQILHFSFLHGFSGPLGQNWRFLGGSRGRMGRYWPPTNSFLRLGVYTSVSNLVKIDKEMRPWVSTDGQTHARTDAKRFYYLSHAICYSYGADS